MTRARGRSALPLIALWSFFAVFTYMLGTIVSDYFFGSSVISFNGKVEYARVAVSSTESQYHWSLAGGYLCFDPDWETPDLSGLGVAPEGVDNALCGGAYGNSPRKYLPLPAGTGLKFLRDTTIEVAIADPPALADAIAFPRGVKPSQMLIIKAVTALSRSEACGEPADGTPLLILDERHTAELPKQVEIHIPIAERTLMPFVGRISLGQENSADTPNMLRSGVIAIYRRLTSISLRSEDPQLVSETNLFPGDVVRFEKGNCLSPSAGFLKGAEDDDGGYLEVVASMHSKDGVAKIQRSTPGGSAASGHFAVELRIADAFFSHPMTLWLGGIVTGFFLLKEWIAALRPAHRLFQKGGATAATTESEEGSSYKTAGSAKTSD